MCVHKLMFIGSIYGLLIHLLKIIEKKLIASQRAHK